LNDIVGATQVSSITGWNLNSKVFKGP